MIFIWGNKKKYEKPLRHSMNEVELKNILGKLEYKSVYKRYTSSNRFQYFMSISDEVNFM